MKQRQLYKVELESIITGNQFSRHFATKNLVSLGLLLEKEGEDSMLLNRIKSIEVLGVVWLEKKNDSSS